MELLIRIPTVLPGTVPGAACEACRPATARDHRMAGAFAALVLLAVAGTVEPPRVSFERYQQLQFAAAPRRRRLQEDALPL